MENIINKNKFVVSGFISRIIEKENYMMLQLALPKYIKKKNEDDKEEVEKLTNYPFIIFSSDKKEALSQYKKGDLVTIEGNFYSGRPSAKEKNVILRLSGTSINKIDYTKGCHFYTKDNLFEVSGKVTFVRKFDDRTVFGVHVIENRHRTLIAFNYYNRNESDFDVNVGDNVTVTGEIRTLIDEKNPRTFKTIIKTKKVKKITE